MEKFFKKMVESLPWDFMKALKCLNPKDLSSMPVQDFVSLAEMLGLDHAESNQMRRELRLMLCDSDVIHKATVSDDAVSFCGENTS